MAVSHVAFTGGLQTNSTSVSATAPTNVSGDIILAGHTTYTNGLETSRPAAFSLVGSNPTDANNNTDITVSKADAVISGSQSFSVSGNQYHGVLLGSFRGVDSIGSIVTSSPTTADLTIPSYTVSSDGSMAVMFWSSYDSAPPSTLSGSGWTRRAAVDDGWIGVWTKPVDAGTVSSYATGFSDGTAQACVVIVLEAGGGTSHAITASGSGTSSGSAAIGLTLGPVSHAITASGTGTSGGSAALIATLVAAASGTGTSAGAASIAATLPASAAGAGASSGAATLARTTTLTAAGSGTSGGSAAIDVATVLPLSAAGSGTTGGVVAATWQQAASAAGSGTSGGSAALTATLVASASGSGTSAGAASFTMSIVLSADGAATSSGSAAIGLDIGGVELSMSASGSGASAGSAAIASSIPFSAAGSGVSDGVAVVAATLVATASGSGASAGAVALGLDVAALSQEGFRFRNDDGTEVTATWIDVQDVAVARDRGVTFGLRVLVDAVSLPSAGVPKLQYRRVGNSDWVDV